ncbi:MAG: polyribonucleotide nucleotidyltransferase, partial [Elusimicrobiota bacterium]
MMEKITEKVEINGRDLVVETGELAKQAGGSVKVSYGETEVLATCCMSPEPSNMPFFPLTVDYRERTYAAGKIPGGFFKREGKPQEKEIITSRLIDRPIRPLFPDGFNHEVQIMITVLSSDEENDSDIPAMLGGSLAVSLSRAPFNGPIGSVRLGKIDDEFVINPTFDQLDESELDIIVAGKEDTVTMIEGEAYETKEEVVLKAIEHAKEPISKIIELQKRVIKQAAKENMEYTPEEIDEELENKVSEFASDKIMEVLKGGYGKQKRSSEIGKIKTETIENFASEEEESGDLESNIKTVISNLEKKLLRKLVTEEDLRVDGRS